MFNIIFFNNLFQLLFLPRIIFLIWCSLYQIHLLSLNQTILTHSVNLILEQNPPSKNIDWFCIRNELLLHNCQSNSVSLAPDARCLLLRYAKHLDLWRLGDTDGCQPDHTQHSLPLSHNVQRLVQLLSKDGQHVRCGAVSGDARWLAYSTDSLFRLYSVDLDSVSDNS